MCCSASDSLAGKFHMPEYSLSKVKLAALAADGWVRVGIRFERIYRTEHFTGSTTCNVPPAAGEPLAPEPAAGLLLVGEK